jgi:hypothetical protein
MKNFGGMILRVLSDEQKRRRKQAVLGPDYVNYETGDMLDTEWSMEQEKKD